MAWNEGLTGSALTIASSTAERLRVLAGPGTGKSFSMIRHVARLLEVENVLPQRILAVTFTRNAAKGLVKDLLEMNVNGCAEIVSGTLHSYCFKLLNSESVLETLGRVPRPIMTFLEKKIVQYEAYPLICDMIAEGVVSGKRAACAKIREFESAWAKLQNDDPGWPTDQEDREIDAFLKRWLFFHQAMFIGEVIPEALNYLRNNPACDERRRFTRVVVDEYQDLNKAEQVLLDNLAENGSLFIVGDEDQSIYRFRHAHPEGIHDFSQRHRNVVSEPLTFCRRCPKQVVRLANSLILHNHAQQAQPILVPFDSNGEGSVKIVQWNSIGEEAAGIGILVKKLVHEAGYDPSDILILTPRRKHAYAIRDSIVGEGIGVHSYYHEEMLEPKPVQEAMNTLSLLINENDRVAQRYWLGQGDANFNAVQYGRLLPVCERDSKSPFEFLGMMTEADAKSGRVERLFSRYTTWITEKARLASSSYSQIVDAIFPASQQDFNAIRDFIAGPLQAVDSLEALQNEIIQFVASPEVPDDLSAVKIMSLHKSKGLTFKVTIIAGVVEGLAPMVPEREDPEYDAILREQRRLFYVAMTRCKERLYISSFVNVGRGEAAQMNITLQGRNAIASRFLRELGSGAPRSVSGEILLQENILPL